MEIRRMSEADVFDVAAIEAKVFSQPWSEQGFRDALAMNHVIFLVAEEAGSILGYCGMYMALDEGEITNVAISEACRNRGYGEQLVTELMQQGRKHGIRRYVLEVRVSNEPAIRLYQKLGFSVLGTRKNFYEKPSEDAYFMSRVQ